MGVFLTSPTKRPRRIGAKSTVMFPLHIAPRIGMDQPHLTVGSSVRL
jgi:hypothetical protein